MASAGYLAGRCVVITGAARGIGEAAARAMAAAGATLILIDSDSHALASVQRSIGPQVAFAQSIDVRHERELSELAADLRSRGVGVDVLINNAAVYSQGPLLELPAGELQRCMEVNALGMVAACRAFVPLMKGRTAPHVMNVLSEFAWLPFPNKGSYCISKAAAAMASACLRAELRGQGIKVTDFVPPPVDTGLIRGAASTRPELLAREAEVVKRHGWKAEDVAERIARAVHSPSSVSICGWMTRFAILAARVFPLASGRIASHAAKRLNLA